MPAQKINAQRSLVAQNRRRIVASLMLRKRLTQLQIQEELAKDPETLNPETGQPWSIGTINSDVKEIRKQWRIEASQHYDDYVAEVHAELKELSNRAWQDEDLKTIVDALKIKMKLFGLEAPSRHEVSGVNGQPIQLMAKSDYVEMAQQQMASLSQQFAAIEDADAR